MQNSTARILLLQAGNADFVAAACAETDRPGCFICKAENQAAQVCRALLQKLLLLQKQWWSPTLYAALHCRSDGDGGDTRRGGKAGPPRWDRTLLFLWLLSCRVRQPRPAEIVLLIPRVSGVVLQRQSPFGPVGSVGESVTANRTPKSSQSDWLPPSVSTAAYRMVPFYPPRACDCKWGGYQQTNKQTGRAWFRGLSQGAHTSDLFTQVPCLVCKCAFLIPDDVAKMAANRHLETCCWLFLDLCDCCVQRMGWTCFQHCVTHLWVSYPLLAALAVISCWLLSNQTACFEEWFENMHFNKVHWACRQDIIKQTKR